MSQLNFEYVFASQEKALKIIQYVWKCFEENLKIYESSSCLNEFQTISKETQLAETILKVSYANTEKV